MLHKESNYKRSASTGLEAENSNCAQNKVPRFSFQFENRNCSQVSEVETLSHLINRQLPLSKMTSETYPAYVNIEWHLLSSELHRLATFRTSPKSLCKSAILLAQNGFAYTGLGNKDSVICVFCGVRHHGWSEGDDIRKVHQQISPNCLMASQGSDHTNVPIHFTTFEQGRCGQSDGMDIDGENVNSDSDSDYDYVEIDAEVDEVDSSELFHSEAGPFFTAEHGKFPDRTSASRNLPSIDQGQTSTISGQPTATSWIDANYSEEISEASLESTSESLVTSNSTSTSGTQSEEVSRSIESTTSLPQYSSENHVGTEASPALSNPPTAESEFLWDQSRPPHQASSSADASISWEQLSIYTEQPKRPEFAHRQAREDTFETWPQGHHIQVSDLAESGFFYAGYGDCARCFFCGGGLRNWEPHDNVFVEHARWFPKCAFVLQTQGPAFVGAVQELHSQGLDIISYGDVQNRLGISPERPNQGAARTETRIQTSPAFLALLDVGYNMEDVLQVAREAMNDSENPLSAQNLMNRLMNQDKWPEDSGDDQENVEYLNQSDQFRCKEILEDQRWKNDELRKRITCKVCLEESVSVLFLPCGHLACCTNCAMCFKTCPICRKAIRGVVQAHLS